ncbi:MAG: DUF6090 family protein [Bacteroidota bacterium]
MIKFFRTIRQRLLAENRFSRYLLYAIGEIVLVVVGILLALQINTSSQNSQNRAKEIKYLESFKHDLESDIVELERVIEKSTRVSQRADSLLMYLTSAEIDFSIKYDRYVFSLTGFTIYLSQEGTVQDIIGSGNLNLITNDSVRLKLVTWDADLKNLREWELLGKATAGAHFEYIRTHFDYYKGGRGESILKESDVLAMKSDLVFLNTVAMRSQECAKLASLYQEELARTQNILSILETELGEID